MASVPEETRSPVLANLVVILGFVLLLSTFATDSPLSWVLGGILLLAGGLWAGFAGGGAAGPDPGGLGDGGAA